MRHRSCPAGLDVPPDGDRRPPRLPRVRFTTLLLGLVLAVLLPALAFGGLAAWQAVEGRQAAAEARLRDTARALALALDREIDRHIDLARGLATAEALDGPEPDLARFEAQARRVLASFGTTAVLLDAASLRQVVNTALPPGRPAGAVAAADFRSVAETGRPLVTDLVAGAVAGRPVVGVAVPVLRDGRIPFVLALRLDPEDLRRLLAEEGLAAGLFAAVTDGHGAPVARSDALDARLPGQTIPEESRRRLAAAPSGLYRAVALDGAERVFGVHRLGSAPGWAAVVAQPAAAFNAAWRAPALALGAGAALALALGGALAVVIARGVLLPVRRLEVYARALAEADGPPAAGSAAAIPPAGVAELEALRQGFAAAEAALAGREARLRTVLDHMPVGVSLAEAPSGRITFSSLRLDAILGHPVMTAAGIAEYGQWEAYHPDGRRVAGSEFPLARALAGEATPVLEYRYRRGDGRLAWLRSNAAPIRDAAGTITGAVVATLDIDAKRRAAEALAESEARLRLATSGAGVGTWELDLVTGQGRWSREAGDLLGIGPLEAGAETWVEALHPDDRAAAAEAWRRAMAEGAPYEASFRSAEPAADGGERWLVSRGIVERDAAGRPLRGLGVLIDLTRQRRAEAALAASEAQLRTVVETVPVGLVMAELPSGRIIGGNRYVEQMLRHPVLHSPDIDSYDEWVSYHADGSRVDGHEYPLARMVQEGEESPAIEVLYQRGDGTRAWTRIMGRPVRNAEGKVTGGVVALLDVDSERRAREALAESESRLRTATENARVGLVVVGRDHRYRFANRAYAEILSLPTHDILGRSVAEVLPSVYAGQIRPRLDRAFGGERVEYDLHRPGAAGVADEHFAVTYEPGSTGAGEPIVVVVITNVTERVLAARVLAEGEARFRAIAESLPALVFETDTAGRNLYVNPRYAAFTGIAADALMGDGWQQALHPDDRGAAHAAWSAAVAAGTPYAQEFRFRHRGGAFRWFLCRGAPIRDGERRITGWVGTCTDIDDQKRAEEARLEGEARLQLALEAGGMGHWSWDLLSDRVEMDARVAALFGLDPAGEPPGGAEALSRVHPDDAPGLNAAIATAVAAGNGTFGHQFRIVHRDGAVRWLRSHAQAMPGPDGHALRLVGLNFDVTDMVHAREVLAREAEELDRLAEELDRLAEERGRALAATEARLAHAARMEALGRLAGGIAHDFNNVLQAVEGGITLASKRLLRDPEQARRYLGLAAEAAGRGAAVTSRLLSFARRGELQAEPVGPAPLLAGLMDFLRPMIGANIALRAEVPPGLPPLLADKGQLEAVLVNLANNARDAMPGGGGLTLGAEAATVPGAAGAPPGLAEGVYVRLFVADDGEGMPPEVLARVSEPFFTTKPKGKGTGLGLAMARGFAEQSGGGLSIESAPGRGTTVSVWLPRVPDRHAGLPEGTRDGVSRMPPLSGELRVLLAEDTPEVRTVLAAQLEDQGYAVWQAENAGAALDLVEAGLRPDALVTDLAMPGPMDGLDLLAALRARLPRLPSVLVTGHAGDAGPGRLELAEHGGPFALLRKPAAPEALFDRLARVLRQAGIPGLKAAH
ncbi:PAS domain S-box protein [Paracraurococcus lichenis]|uniref:histidine kinase n=1 Tax=Paracraurococcus lichenis TaxID=3064888 RepID=A0ABT9DZJ0_9PROT|nr:PAS domain S-box protein [Paracraurococcus sp. LOR1-02]MDO9709317.1 PAS domain S-box protein [Paracraurococcus sp. LOR1-02]